MNAYRSLERLLVLVCAALLLTACGGGESTMPAPPAERPPGGGDRTPDDTTPPAATSQPLSLPDNHGLASGRYTVGPGASEMRGNVVLTCPAGDATCVIEVQADGSATYNRTGGAPAAMAAYATWTLPDNHGIAAGRYTVAPGASEMRGNVVLTCPAGGAACVIEVQADASATYSRTGGAPTAMAAYATWTLPANHGLAAGRYTVAPGASETRGNIVLTCPAGGGACVIEVQADGSATYNRTGGAPTAMAAYATWTLPDNHGLAVGRYTVAPGASEMRGNVVLACPAGGAACVVEVQADGSATYARTGGAPAATAAYAAWTLPDNHGLAAGTLHGPDRRLRKCAATSCWRV